MAYIESVKGSRLIYLGDLTLGGIKKTEELLEHMGSMFSKVDFVLGNHDSDVKKLVKRHPATEHHFGYSTLHNFTFREVFFTKEFELPITFSHPFIASWYEKRYGAANIHGHVHGAYEESLPMNLSQRALDVTYESIGKFGIPISECLTIIKSKKFPIRD